MRVAFKVHFHSRSSLLIKIFARVYSTLKDTSAIAWRKNAVVKKQLKVAEKIMKGT